MPLTDEKGQYFTKAPTAVGNFTLNWATFLGADTITGTPSWSVPSGITKDSQSNTTTTTTVVLSGGTAGVEYELVCTIQTTQGNTWPQTLRIRVTPFPTLAATALVTLAELKGYIGKRSAVPDEEVLNSLLGQLINAASREMEDRYDTYFIQRSITQAELTGGINGYLGGSKRMRLRGPINSVTSITDTGGTTVPSTDYYVFRWYLEHKGSWPAPTGRWTVVYNAGRFANVTAVNPDVKLACNMLASSAFYRRNPSVSQKTVGDLSLQYSGESESTSGLWTRIDDLMSPYWDRSF